MSDMAAMKQQARATWAAGDFDSIVPFIWEAGGVAAEASGCGPGDRVLDIAAGSGKRFDGGIDAMTDHFMTHFGPMVMARRALEPEGRWDEFLAAYRDLARRWNEGGDDEAALPAAYLLVTGTRKG